MLGAIIGDVLGSTFEFYPANIVAGNFYKDMPWSV